MPLEVEHMDEFGEWWHDLTASQQDAAAARAGLLMEHSPDLPFPNSSRATTLNVNQPAMAKLEQRADIYVSSLHSYIEAVGGRLKIIAEFPDGEVTITNFSRLGENDDNCEGGN